MKLLQLDNGDEPVARAAATLPVPEEVRESTEEMMDYYARELPGILRDAQFKGRQAICAIPATQTHVQHLQITPSEGISQDEIVRSQLGMQMGIAPGSIVVRTFKVRELQRDGKNLTEIICVSIPRDVVMRYVSMLVECRLEVLSVHSSSLAMVRAFDHVHRRSNDAEVTSMYIDCGYSGTRVAIAHDRTMVFARSIQVGGQHFDQMIADQRKCSTSEAQAYRLAMSDAMSSAKSAAGGCDSSEHAPDTNQADNEDSSGGLSRLNAAMAKEEQSASSVQPESPEQSVATLTEAERRQGEPPITLRENVSANGTPTAEPPDLSELLDTVTDELSMCIRYHQGLFPQRSIDRVVLVGGESKQRWLCQHIARGLRISTRLGDPAARLLRADRTSDHVPIEPNKPNPEWAIAAGLSAMQNHE